MRYRWILAFAVVMLIGFGLWRFFVASSDAIFNPLGEIGVKKEKPYLKYSFERLSQRGGTASQIEVRDNMFYYNAEGRRISGAITYPNDFSSSEIYPVVVMARGYVEKEGYKTGTGTKNAANYYAKSGYVTLAPDFSGYGESDPEDENALGARLTKPAEILDLLVSLSSLRYLDLSRVYLWGHSNGGQIMLSVAEMINDHNSQNIRILGATLWAPVSKPFPYNILFYTDDASDSGKWLRAQIAEFEKDYDVFDFSIDKYIESINIPIQIHQGSADDAVPKKWSDQLVENLKDKNKDVVYYVYPGADHNMRPSWDSVVARDVEWFNTLAEENK